MRILCTSVKRSPHLPELEKVSAQQQRPTAAKNIKQKQKNRRQDHWENIHFRGCSSHWVRTSTFLDPFFFLLSSALTHSSVLDWRIPGTAEPGGLSSMRSHRVGHDWSNLAGAALAAGFPWGDYLFLGGNNFDPSTAVVMPPVVGRDNLVGLRLQQG